MDPSNPLPALELRAVSGPTRPALPLHPPGPVTIGRRPGHTLELADEGVSRDHAELILPPGERAADAWRLRDAGSRHGTWLNGVRLPAGRETPIRHADVVAIHPWVFNVFDPRVGDTQTTRVETLEDSMTVGAIVSTVDRGGDTGLTRRRLDLLLEAASRMSEARDERALAEAVIDAARDGAGFANAAVLRPARDAEEFEALAARGEIVEGGRVPRVSRSLIRRAGEGSAARISGQSPAGEQGVSIVALSIDEALCAPIIIGSGVAAYLYLDNRGGTRAEMTDEAEAFAIGLARFASLALSNLFQRELESRYTRIQAELEAAAEAQRWILPRAANDRGGFSIVGRSRPGRGMAGDFYDAIELEDDRIAVTLGDVSGKGAAASVLMTASQGFLHASLREHADPVRGVRDLARFVSPRTPESRFVTLWLGVFDPAARALEYVDAGHGYAFLRRSDGSIEALNRAGGPVVGVPDAEQYASARVTLDEGGAILVVSDGLVEQPDEARGSATRGEPFGAGRVESLLAESTPDEAFVDALFDAVMAHAGGESLADDATAVLIRW